MKRQISQLIGVAGMIQHLNNLKTVVQYVV